MRVVLRRFSSSGGLPPKFDPKLSKYSGQRMRENVIVKVERKDAPEYLQDQEKFLAETKKSYELQNPEELKAIKA